ncbi:MAG: CHAP domain-containing protein [Cyanobacteria bacterium P01_G01_bin.54]
MTILVSSPKANSEYMVYSPVSFQGTADTPITKVKIIADSRWILGKVLVDQGNWSFQYSFNTIGNRVISAHGFNDSNDEIGIDNISISIQSKFTRKRLADIAEEEASEKLKYPEMVKYTRKFNPVFGSFTSSRNYEWCAVFVTWCCEQVGLAMPIHAPGDFGYTFGLVEAWQQWAISVGYYHDNNGLFSPQRGDIVVFDWGGRTIPDTDWENHIGIFLSINGDKLICAEGNVGAKDNTLSTTAIKSRESSTIQGFIRLPDGLRVIS